MPNYGFLADKVIDGRYIQDVMATHRMVGVPYTDEMIANAQADFKAQADPNGDTRRAGRTLWRGAWQAVNVRNFDGQPELTEMDALIAYLQVLGTMVDFSTYTPDASR